jgi:hypothetical protein
VEVGVKEVLRISKEAGKEDNGKFFDIYVPGWAEKGGFNAYLGGVLPW